VDVPSDFDHWPDEPQEENPESRWGNPEDELVKVPSVDVPNAEMGANVEADPELAKTFWVSVFFANVALGGISLGLMLLYFRGMWIVGGGAFLVGVFALVRVYTFYRAFERDDNDDGDTHEDPTDDE
jgi:hypothetical protein